MAVKQRIIADLIGTMQDEFNIGTGKIRAPAAGSAIVELPNQSGTIAVVDSNGNLINANTSSGAPSNDYNALINIPASFPPDAHRHDASEIDNLPTGGGGPVDYAELLNVPTEFQPVAHRHDASEIDNLPAGGGACDWSEITNKPTIGSMAAQNDNNVNITGGSIANVSIKNAVIGATQPAAARVSVLKINGGTYNPFALAFGPGSNVGWTNPTDAGTGPFLTSDGNHIQFLNKSSSEGMRFTTSKNLLINTTTDDLTNKLQVAGSAKIAGGLIIKPPATNTPQNQGEVTFELINNTTLRIRAMGSDGLIRSVIFTLA